MTDEQMHHLTDEPLPSGVYDSEQAALITYAQKSTRLQPIDDKTYNDLSTHFSQQQIVDLCLTVGMSNVINRFHATFQTDVDAATLDEVAAGNNGESPIELPQPPGAS